MRKNYLYIFIIFIFCAIFSSCDIIPDMSAYYIISLKNCTNEIINVTIEEDSDTRLSQKYGTYSTSKTILPNFKVKTEAVTNDFYKISVNGSVIHPSTYDQFGKSESGSDDYHLIAEDCTVVEIKKNDNGFYYDISGY